MELPEPNDDLDRLCKVGGDFVIFGIVSILPIIVDKAHK